MTRKAVLLKSQLGFNQSVNCGVFIGLAGWQPVTSKLLRIPILITLLISLVKKLCYPEAHRFTSVATSWGRQHESDAIDEFIESFAIDRIDARFEKCGLVVNKKYPFLGASPDGNVHCACHGRSLLEAKCLYRCCNKPLSDVVQQDVRFCLNTNKYLMVLCYHFSCYYKGHRCSRTEMNIDIRNPTREFYTYTKGN